MISAHPGLPLSTLLGLTLKASGMNPLIKQAVLEWGALPLEEKEALWARLVAVGAAVIDEIGGSKLRGRIVRSGKNESERARLLLGLGVSPLSGYGFISIAVSGIAGIGLAIQQPALYRTLLVIMLIIIAPTVMLVYDTYRRETIAFAEYLREWRTSGSSPRFTSVLRAVTSSRAHLARVAMFFFAMGAVCVALTAMLSC